MIINGGQRVLPHLGTFYNQKDLDWQQVIKKKLGRQTFGCHKYFNNRLKVLFESEKCSQLSLLFLKIRIKICTSSSSSADCQTRFLMKSAFSISLKINSLHFMLHLPTYLPIYLPTYFDIILQRSQDAKIVHSRRCNSFITSGETKKFIKVFF